MVEGGPSAVIVSPFRTTSHCRERLCGSTAIGWNDDRLRSKLPASRHCLRRGGRANTRTGRGEDRMANKIAFVTGAGSGIGRATAMLFASRGHSVALVDMNEAGGRETEAAIRLAG